MVHQTVAAAPDDEAIHVLADRLRGQILRPDDPSYDAARQVWNAMIDRRPALIARCAGAADVIAAVAFAREHELPLSVRGGGHGVAGKAVCDDGLMIDLAPMKGIRIDPVACTARAEPGVLWEEFGWHHRHRRADPRRRAGLADRQARPDPRQPPRCRCRHRRRPVAPRQRR
jgi:hypothetical protein